MEKDEGDPEDGADVNELHERFENIKLIPVNRSEYTNLTDNIFNKQSQPHKFFTSKHEKTHVHPTLFKYERAGSTTQLFEHKYVK